MPIYESEEITREELEKIRKRNVCAVCGGWLNTFLDPESGKIFIACNEWPRSHHEGIEREASRYEKEGVASLNIKTREEIMNQKYGEEKTRALAKYQMTAMVTRKMATEIVETLWKGASPIAKTKAIILCATYNLNPLMNHLFILPFKRKDGTIEHVVAIGIEATRLMAHRKHNCTYLDLTPRRATRDELEKILGDEVDPKKLYFITKLKDLDTQAEVYGLGWWEGAVYGADKGNSPANMASIRSERQAIKRLYPAEMPTGVEVVDERFAEAAGEGVIEGEFTEVYDAAGNKIEGDREAAKSPADERAEHWCEEHNCAFELKKSRYGQFYSHKLPGGGYCKESDQLKKKKEPAPKAAPHIPESTGELPSDEPEPEPDAVEEPQKPERDPSTIKTLNELYKACNEDFKLQPDQVIKELGVSSQTDISDSPEECYRKIAKVR